MADERLGTDVENDAQKPQVSRRKLLGGVVAAAGVGGVSSHQYFFQNAEAMAAEANLSSNDLIIETEDGNVSSVELNGDSTEVAVDYENFGQDLDSEENNFLVDISLEFSSEVNVLASGTIDVGETPHDTVTELLGSESIAGGDVTLSDHSSISDDYAEFEPADDEEEKETELTFYINAEFEEYGLESSDSVTATVTVTVDESEAGVLFGESTDYTVDNTPQEVVYDEETGSIHNLISSGDEDIGANGMNFYFEDGGLTNDQISDNEVPFQLTTHDTSGSSSFEDRRNQLLEAYNSDGDLIMEIFAWEGDSWNLYYLDTESGDTGYEEVREEAVSSGVDARSNPVFGFGWDDSNSHWYLFVDDDRYNVQHFNSDPIDRIDICGVGASGWHDATIEFDVDEIIE